MTSEVEALPRTGFAKIKEAAEFLAVSQPSLYRLAQQGRIPSIAIGSQRRIAWSWLYEQLRIASGADADAATTGGAA